MRSDIPRWENIDKLLIGKIYQENTKDQSVPVSAEFAINTLKSKDAHASDIHWNATSLQQLMKYL